jgi:hypothetical protein
MFVEAKQNRTEIGRRTHSKTNYLFLRIFEVTLRKFCENDESFVKANKKGLGGG